MEMKLEDLTETEIKAHLYDQIILLQQTQNNIKILETELQKRANETPKVG